MKSLEELFLGGNQTETETTGEDVVNTPIEDATAEEIAEAEAGMKSFFAGIQQGLDELKADAEHAQKRLVVARLNESLGQLVTLTGFVATLVDDTFVNEA